MIIGPRPPRGVRARMCTRVTGFRRRLTPQRPGEARPALAARLAAAVRRGFAVYWRLIYPGSPLIRTTWLAAIKARAEQAAPRPLRAAHGKEPTHGYPGRN
jgi:hypothetical protein